MLSQPIIFLCMQTQWMCAHPYMLSTQRKSRPHLKITPNNFRHQVVPRTPFSYFISLTLFLQESSMCQVFHLFQIHGPHTTFTCTLIPTVTTESPTFPSCLNKPPYIKIISYITELQHTRTSILLTDSKESLLFFSVQAHTTHPKTQLTNPLQLPSLPLATKHDQYPSLSYQVYGSLFLTLGTFTMPLCQPNGYTILGCLHLCSGVGRAF